MLQVLSAPSRIGARTGTKYSLTVGPEVLVLAAELDEELVEVPLYGLQKDHWAGLQGQWFILGACAPPLSITRLHHTR